MKVKLRGVRTQPALNQGRQGILLSDPLGISDKAIFIPSSAALLLTLMDGTRDIGALRTGFELRTGTPFSGSVLEQLVSHLDEALFLENDRFLRAYEVALDSYRSASSRPPVLAGNCYPADAAQLNTFLQQYFDQVEDGGSGCPGEVRGLISPHIDFERGGPIYAGVWSGAQAAVRQAELVVILGTDHNDGKGRVTLTRQSYETPLGVFSTAQDVVDELAGEIGEDAFACELNHRGEHSIEAALIWLHYLLGDRTCRLLPILCGAFEPFLERRESPLQAPHIASTVEVLKAVSSRMRTVIVAAADLAHVGPVFGDPSPLDFAGRARMATQDEELIGTLSRGNAEEFLAEISQEGNRRHVCGVPPIYIALAALPGATGTTVGYAQCPASDDQTSMVSICGMLY